MVQASGFKNFKATIVGCWIIVNWWCGGLTIKDPTGNNCLPNTNAVAIFRVEGSLWYFVSYLLCIDHLQTIYPCAISNYCISNAHFLAIGGEKVAAGLQLHVHCNTFYGTNLKGYLCMDHLKTIYPRNTGNNMLSKHPFLGYMQGRRSQQACSCRFTVILSKQLTLTEIRA